MFNRSQRPPYTPSNWYWQIADTIYSSAVAGYVSPTASEFIAWKDAGNLPTKIANEAELFEVLTKAYPAGLPTPPVPDSVRNAQLRLALLDAGKLTAAVALAAQADEATKILWEFEPEIHRDHPLIATFGAMLGFSPAQLDALFIAAALKNVQAP